MNFSKIDIVAKAAANDTHMIESAIEEYPDHYFMLILYVADIFYFLRSHWRYIVTHFCDASSIAGMFVRLVAALFHFRAGNF
mmetsp:Transcript_31908/g.46389  ORF Transcript_31908/g.46389 Transcript_31908/m.46389 type:complete len:82 (-) Transcript_31908:51-296(-)